MAIHKFVAGLPLENVDEQCPRRVIIESIDPNDVPKTAEQSETARFGMCPNDRVELGRHCLIRWRDRHRSVRGLIGLAICAARRVAASGGVNGEAPVELSPQIARHGLEGSMLIREEGVAAMGRDGDGQ